MTHFFITILILLSLLFILSQIVKDLPYYKTIGHVTRKNKRHQLQVKIIDGIKYYRIYKNFAQNVDANLEKNTNLVFGEDNNIYILHNNN